MRLIHYNNELSLPENLLMNRGHLGIALILSLFLVNNLLFAQNQNSGVPWVGEKGTSETVEQIMARERLVGIQEEERESEQEKEWPDRRNLPQNPASPATSQWPLLKEQPSLQSPSFSPQTLGTNFLAATLSGTNPTSAFPPDVMGDVGPTQYIIAVNGRIVTFTKSTGTADGVLNASMNTFFTSVRNLSGTSDPRIRYDRLTGRWFVIIINVASTNNRVLFAVSNTATITGATVWTYYYFQHNTVLPAGNTSQFADYPTLGLDANALYIGCNMFTSAGSFSNVTGFVVRKSSLTSGGPIVATAFRNLLDGSFSGPYTPQGVDNFDAAATEGYFIGIDGATFGTLMIRRVSDPGGTPTISGNISVTVPATSSPANVRHSGNTGGTNGRLSALDDRLFQAVIRNGRLWTAHNILVDNTGAASGTMTRNGCRWYELQNLTTTPALVQSGTVYTATGTNTVDERNYSIPSVMVSGQGHVAMGFTTAGTSEFANAGTVGRLSGDAAGTMQTPVLYTASSTAYNPASDPGSATIGRRWGDYSYTSLDPDDDMTMWTAHEYCNATNSYGVRVVKLIAPPPATPSSASPPSVASGQSSVNVTITGISSSGSGFYDPGSGFTNRLAANVSGGVVVNSVTYNSPTSVTLNLNTVGASGGTKNVTITNPDAQFLTGVGILTVATGSASITVTSPNGGESWPVGSGQNIQWASSNVTGNVKIEVSTNGGSSYSAITMSTANDGTEPWTVNASPTASARIRVTSLDSINARDSSNANFTIVQPTLTVTAPNGGETWAIGTPQNIQWSSTNLTGNVRIELSRNGGTSFAETLFVNTANDGSQAWTVTGPVTSGMRIRVVGVSVTSVADTGNANAQIVQPLLFVTAANGGENWYVGSTQNAQWTSQYVTGNVIITLSRNSGATFPDTLFSSTPNDSIQSWTVSGPATANARIRIASLSMPGIADTSDADFSIIQASLSLVSPNGGETWYRDSSYALQWNSSNLPGNVLIALSRNDGATYPETLFANTSNDGVENWTATAPLTSQARLKVISVDLPFLQDASNTSFSIIFPSLSVIAPVAAEVWPVGSNQTIQWSSSNITGNVTIDLSRDGGLTFPETLSTNTLNDGAEQWTVTGPAVGENARIRIASMDFGSVLDTSDVFAIEQPSLVVSQANGGETWLVGSTQNIQWSSSYVPGNVSIVLSRDGGATYTDTLFASTPSDSVQSWIVTGPVTANARIRIAGISVPVSDESDTDFAIVQPTLTVVSANGGETWLAGSSETIQWNSTNLTGNVTILLSRDGGATYSDTLFASTPDDGAENWIVSGPGTPNARVRLVSIDAPTLSDMSDNDFTIGVPFVTVASPDGGETLEIDSTISIQWTSGFTSGNVMIELSRDGGTTYETLFASTSDDGAESWNVSGPATNQGRIRVTNLLTSSATDSSTSLFAIGKTTSVSVIGGWNMLSVPVTVSDLRKEQVFPPATSDAFRFTASGYIPEDTLRYDVGYWLKFPSAQNVTLFGDTRELDTVHVVSGWNMIGTISSGVPVDSIIQNPPGIVVSSYFGYNGLTYASADTLKTMRAFWVKVNQPGTLVLKKSIGPLPPKAR